MCIEALGSFVYSNGRCIRRFQRTVNGQPREGRTARQERRVWRREGKEE
jgi:hypothetical protein